MKIGSGCVLKETDFGLFLRAGWGSGGAWRMGDCGGEESPPARVGGKGRSMRDGRLRISFSFLDSLWGGVDFFGLTVQNTKSFRERCNLLKRQKRSRYRYVLKKGALLDYVAQITIFSHSSLFVVKQLCRKSNANLWVEQRRAWAFELKLTPALHMW